MGTTTVHSVNRQILTIFSCILILLTAHASAQTDATGKVYRVGGGVSAPRVTHAPDPKYTEEARAAKYQGRCVLRLVVGEDGRPRDITVTNHLGYGLDEKAVDAVKRWKFIPAMKDGNPVAVYMNVEVAFHIPGGPAINQEPGTFTKEQLDQIYKQWRKKYTPDQLADFRTECGPYTDTKVEDLESEKAPLPPHECVAVLPWMQDLRVEALYIPQGSKQ